MPHRCEFVFTLVGVLRRKIPTRSSLRSTLTPLRRGTGVSWAPSSEVPEVPGTTLTPREKLWVGLRDGGVGGTREKRGRKRYIWGPLEKERSSAFVVSGNYKENILNRDGSLRDNRISSLEKRSFKGLKPLTPPQQSKQKTTDGTV